MNKEKPIMIALMFILMLINALFYQTIKVNANNQLKNNEIQVQQKVENNKIKVQHNNKEYNFYMLRTYSLNSSDYYYFNQDILKNQSLIKQSKNLTNDILKILEKYITNKDYITNKYIINPKDINGIRLVNDKDGNKEHYIKMYSIKNQFSRYKSLIFREHSYLFNNPYTKSDIFIFYKIIDKNNIKVVLNTRYLSFNGNLEIEKKIAKEIEQILERYAKSNINPNLIYISDYTNYDKGIKPIKKEKVIVKPKIKPKPAPKPKPKIHSVKDIEKDFGFVFQKINITPNLAEKCNISYLEEVDIDGKLKRFMFSTMKDFKIEDYKNKQILKEKENLKKGYNCVIEEYNKINKTGKTINDLDGYILYRPYSKNKIYFNYIKNKKSFNNFERVISRYGTQKVFQFKTGIDRIYKKYETLAKDIGFDRIKKIYPNATLKDVLINTNNYTKLNKDILDQINLKKRSLSHFNNKEYHYIYNSQNALIYLKDNSLFLDNNFYRYYYFKKTENHKCCIDTTLKLIGTGIYIMTILVIFLYFLYLYDVKLIRKKEERN